MVRKVYASAVFCTFALSACRAGQTGEEQSNGGGQAAKRAEDLMMEVKREGIQVVIQSTDDDLDLSILGMMADTMGENGLAPARDHSHGRYSISGGVVPESEP